MIEVKELIRWADTLDINGDVAIDDGGVLVELDAEGKATGAYLEVGGPEEEEP